MKFIAGNQACETFSKAHIGIALESSGMPLE